MTVIITTMDKLPEYCYNCPCHDGEGSRCRADTEERDSIYRPFWCPLKMSAHWVDDGSIEKCPKCGCQRDFPTWIACPECGEILGGKAAK